MCFSVASYEEHGLWHQTARIQTMILPLNSCVALDDILNPNLRFFLCKKKIMILFKKCSDTFQKHYL